MEQRTNLLIRPRRRDRSLVSPAAYTIELEFGDGRRIVATEDVQFNLTPPETADPDSISRYGQELFRRLFPERISHAFRVAHITAAQQQQSLRLRLALDPLDNELQAIPWELLHIPSLNSANQFIPVATSDQILFSRYIDSEQFPLRDPIEHRPIRLLLALSEPADLARWGLASFDRKATEQDFRQRFRPFIDTRQVECDVLPVAEESALYAALERGSSVRERERGFDVVLYIGHALFQPQYGTRLLLEHGPQRRGRLLDGSDLARMLTQLPDTHKPALICLIACNSATVDLHAPLSNLAARLITESGIPAVIAMQRLVAIDQARAFTQHLTEMLLRNGLIDLAVATARRRIYRPDTVSWSTPVLYTRLSSGRLFQPSSLLSYVEWVLQQDDIRRWAGNEYIDVDCIAIPQGQNWQLIQRQAENGPQPASTRDTLINLLTASAAGSDHRLIVLTGAHQSGHTTILRRVCHDLARNALLDINATVGIIVSLAGYEQARGELRLLHHIVEQVQHQHAAFAEMLAKFLQGSSVVATQRPRLVFLLDDVEQVAEPHWRDIVRDLLSLRDRIPDQRFVVAAPQSFAPLVSEHQAHLLVIQPLTEPGIVTYIRQRNRRSARNILERMREYRLHHLASDPRMLTIIYDRLSSASSRSVTYHGIIEEFLTQELRTIDQRYQMGGIARESLYTIAWRMRWSLQSYVSIGEVFTILNQVRRNRDYSLEDLFRQLSDTQLIVIIGQQEIRFANQAISAYCAAQALYRDPERHKWLADIVALCADVERQRWWEDVLYVLAGLLDKPEELLACIAAALRKGNSRLALLAARCLEALPAARLQTVSLSLRNELIDNCLLQLDEQREPSAERRELLVSALGKIDHPQVRQQLRRILVDKVRQTSSGPRYEYTSVRIAAARALRDLYLPNFSLRDGKPVQSPFDRATIALKQLRDDRPLVELMSQWLQGETGRQELRHRISTSPLAPERSIAAFVLADVSEAPANQLHDARFLLRLITSPTDTIETRVSDDWIDTMWSAADALTLFDPEYVTPLIAALIKHKRSMPNPAAQQLAYLVGRLRMKQPFVIDWLIGLLVTNPSQNVKARALQSLAWIGSEATNRMIVIDGEARDNALTVKQLIEEIALWRQTLPRFTNGEFVVDFPAHTSSPIYLRGKAIEALAWIGDRDTLRELDSDCQNWPLELRARWHTARAIIQERTG
ncbi:CHAT domain-containing protein [Chloroflexus sp.]|uniref:CHAT domain-containing protein n=1 Tax=Chloroflexus sp. TaxID=1904827 RepID=UPI0026076DDC|nr:CHAT domain-containing protein [uncultured Chloroflexus sp.]